MKKIIAIAAAAVISAVAAFAQPGFEGGFGHGPYAGGYGPRYGSYSAYPSYGMASPRRQPGGPGRGGYGRGMDRGGRFDDGCWYGGFTVGMTASHVSSQSSELDGNRIATGLSLGAALGYSITPAALFETGLYYVEKGGSSNDAAGRFTYDLNYLEIPLIFKFQYYTGSNFTLQPFIGGYLGLGISGDIKDYNNREAFRSYSNGYFRRGDSGLRFGCGAAYSFFYASVSYDLGLTNIGQDLFSDTKNRALTINVGFAF